MPRPLLAALGSLPLLACGGPEAVPDPYPNTPGSVAQDPDAGQPFRDVADSIPSFGGAYSENRTLVILMVDGATRAEKDAARTWGDRLVGSERGVAFARADYSWRQLLDARSLAAPVLGVEGVTSVSLDHRTNRVLVGVIDPGAGARARAFLDDTGTDPGMFRIERMEPFVFIAD